MIFCVKKVESLQIADFFLSLHSPYAHDARGECFIINHLTSDCIAFNFHMEEAKKVANENFDWNAFENDLGVYDQPKEQIGEAYDKTLSNIAANEVTEGTVIGINKREVVVNIGYKSEGVIPVSEFRYNPDLKVGDKIEVYVESAEDKGGQLVLSHKKARQLKSWDRVNEALEKDEIIKGYIKCRTKGGMIVDVFGIEAENTDITGGELNKEGYKSVAKQLADKFNFEMVAITLRESKSAFDNDWSAMLYNVAKDEYCFSKLYHLHIIDRIGGGDSFGGGLIYALLSGKDTQAAVEFAVAASALKHSVEGDFNRVTLAEVEKLALSILTDPASVKVDPVSSTVDRIVDAFPPAQQQQIRTQLSMVLNAVISQQLVPTVDGGVQPVFEIMFLNNAIRNMIRESKIHQIDGIIATSQEEGMISMDNSLIRLFRQGVISRETAVTYSSNGELMERKLSR